MDARDSAVGVAAHPGVLLRPHLRHGDTLRLSADSLAVYVPLQWQIQPHLRFIIDYRDFSPGFMRSAPEGTLTRSPGPLIWQISAAGDSERDVELLEADGTEGVMNAVTDLVSIGADYSHRFKDGGGSLHHLDIMLQNPGRLLLRHANSSGPTS